MYQKFSSFLTDIFGEDQEWNKIQYLHIKIPKTKEAKHSLQENLKSLGLTPEKFRISSLKENERNDLEVPSIGIMIKLRNDGDLRGFDGWNFPKNVTWNSNLPKTTFEMLDHCLSNFVDC